MMIRLNGQGITAGYGGVDIIKNVNLDVNSGYSWTQWSR